MLPAPFLNVLLSCRSSSSFIEGTSGDMFRLNRRITFCLSFKFKMLMTIDEAVLIVYRVVEALIYNKLC